MAENIKLDKMTKGGFYGESFDVVTVTIRLLFANVTIHK